MIFLWLYMSVAIVLSLCKVLMKIVHGFWKGNKGKQLAFLCTVENINCSDFTWDLYYLLTLLLTKMKIISGKVCLISSISGWCSIRTRASYEYQRWCLDCRAEGANLVTQTCGKKETVRLVPSEREMRGLDFFFLVVRTSVERLVIVANVGTKKLRKNLKI